MQEGNQIVGSAGAAQERGEGGKEGGWLMVEDGCRKEASTESLPCLAGSDPPNRKQGALEQLVAGGMVSARLFPSLATTITEQQASIRSHEKHQFIVVHSFFCSFLSFIRAQLSFT